VRIVLIAIIAAVGGAAAGFAVGWIAADDGDSGSSSHVALDDDAKLARAYVAAAFVTGAEAQRCPSCELVDTWHVADRTWAVRYRSPGGKQPEQDRCALVNLDQVQLRLGEQVFVGHAQIDCDEAKRFR
jgi:hypothetical protein